MAKFPTQKLMTYDLTGIDDATMASVGYLNIPKDLSILNRRGYASTTRKGVPLVYRCRVTYQLGDDLGRRGYATGDGSTAYAADMISTLKIVGCQNNWVMRNAAVKWHAARDAMWRQAGVKKSHLGAYAHEIRYAYDAQGQSWLSPIDGDGAAFTGGTWDLTEINNGIDEDGFELKLVGTGLDEDSAQSPTVVNIGHSFLQSRRQPDPDTNEGADGTPSNHGLLNATLFDISDDGSASPKDDIVSNAKGQGDELPYEVFDGNTTDHDITESVELGRAVVSIQRPTASVIVDIPFGLANLRASVDLDGTSTDEPNGLAQIDVLKIFEMQG